MMIYDLLSISTGNFRFGHPESIVCHWFVERNKKKEPDALLSNSAKVLVLPCLVTRIRLYAGRMLRPARPSRRQLLAAAPAALLSAQEPSQSRLRVVCVGGHPDDPESGCGGTLARYAALGHVVTILYLTRGEAGVAGKNHEEAARIRSAECEAACKILGARAVFAGQIDGATMVDAKAAESLRRLIAAENADVVLTHTGSLRG